MSVAVDNRPVCDRTMCGHGVTAADRRRAAGPGAEELDMASRWLTEHDIHALTREFLNSGYGGSEYGHWPLERRVHGFLRRHGLGRYADNGDICNIITDHVMTCVSVTRRQESIDSMLCNRQLSCGAVDSNHIDRDP